jgi:hypothetical protein
MGGETAPRVDIGASRTKSGTIDSLVVTYYKSDEWGRFTPDTQKTRKRIIEGWEMISLSGPLQRVCQHDAACTVLRRAACAVSPKWATPLTN